MDGVYGYDGLLRAEHEEDYEEDDDKGDYDRRVDGVALPVPHGRWVGRYLEGLHRWKDIGN